MQQLSQWRSIRNLSRAWPEGLNYPPCSDLLHLQNQGFPLPAKLWWFATPSLLLLSFCCCFGNQCLCLSAPHQQPEVDGAWARSLTKRNLRSNTRINNSADICRESAGEPENGQSNHDQELSPSTALCTPILCPLRTDSPP